MDNHANARATEEMERLGGEGLRVMVAATRDIDPAISIPRATCWRRCRACR